MVRVTEAITHINRRACLLVFPLQNQKEPPSLWSCFFPRSRMRWEWDDSGDNRVGALWQVREELSRSEKVVYAKWFRGRATFFSREIFPALLRALNPTLDACAASLTGEAARVLRVLEESSPLSTKALKKETDLQGKNQESAYQRALKQLWNRLLIVGYGEVDDGAFPSLAIGSTQLLFESLWKEACSLSDSKAHEIINSLCAQNAVFLQYYLKLRASLLREKKGTLAPGPTKAVSPLRFESLSSRRPR